MRSVGVLEIQPELGEAEIGSVRVEEPDLTERVEFEGSLESLIATLGDEPAPNTWLRWFRSAHDGVDVGLDLLPFDVEDDWHPSVEWEASAAAEPEPEPAPAVPPAPKARRTGKLRSRRMRIALVGIASLAVLNLGASLSDRAGAPDDSPASGGAATARPGTLESRAHIDGLRFFPLPALSSSLGARAEATGPAARR